MFRNTKASIIIDAVSGFAYEYTLYINGKPLQKFTKNRKKQQKLVMQSKMVWIQGLF